MTNTNKSIITRFERIRAALVGAGLATTSEPVRAIGGLSARLELFAPDTVMLPHVAARLADWFAGVYAPDFGHCDMRDFLYWLLMSETPRLDSVIDEARGVIESCDF